MSGIVIVSFRGDLHAEIIRHTLRKNFQARCSILEVDALAYSSSVSIEFAGGRPSFRFLDSEGLMCDLSDFSVVWWRRGGYSQISEAAHKLSSEEISLVRNDCSAAIRGGMLEAFSGTWISHPMSTSAAEDKIFQLRVAASCGLRIPRTVVTQDIAVVERFVRDVGGRAVVKPLRGTVLAPIFSAIVYANCLNAEAVSAAPAIYQEYISGRDHLRVHLFGDTAVTVKLSTDEMDWRATLEARAELIDVDAEILSVLVEVRRRMKLEMGIFDLKIDNSGSLYWFEVNPQGQFLFLEPMTGFDFKSAFSEYLMSRQQ